MFAESVLLFYCPFIGEIGFADRRTAVYGIKRRRAMQKSRRQADYDYIKQVSDSQNFLTDSKLLQRIIRSADIQKGDMVLEIGTGKGHLTEALCKGRERYARWKLMKDLWSVRKSGCQNMRMSSWFREIL